MTVKVVCVSCKAQLFYCTYCGEALHYRGDHECVSLNGMDESDEGFIDSSSNVICDTNSCVECDCAHEHCVVIWW